MNEEPPSNIEVPVTSLSEPQTIKWRPKIRPKNKLRMNMREILDPKFKRDAITTIEEYSSEEDHITKNVEQTLSQTIEDTERSIKFLPEIFERKYEAKEKQNAHRIKCLDSFKSVRARLIFTTKLK